MQERSRFMASWVRGFLIEFKFGGADVGEIHFFASAEFVPSNFSDAELMQ